MFGPFIAQAPAGPLEAPFGMHSLRHALLLLRMCYRPEELGGGAAQLL